MAGAVKQERGETAEKIICIDGKTMRFNKMNEWKLDDRNHSCVCHASRNDIIDIIE